MLAQFLFKTLIDTFIVFTLFSNNLFSQPDVVVNASNPRKWRTKGGEFRFEASLH